MEQLEGVLHSTAADVAGTDVAVKDNFIQRVRDMDSAARQAFLAQLNDAESKVVEQLNKTLDAARFKPGWTPLSYAVIGATPQLSNSTCSLTSSPTHVSSACRLLAESGLAALAVRCLSQALQRRRSSRTCSPAKSRTCRRPCRRPCRCRRI